MFPNFIDETIAAIFNPADQWSQLIAQIDPSPETTAAILGLQRVCTLKLQNLKFLGSE